MEGRKPHTSKVYGGDIPPELDLFANDPRSSLAVPRRAHVLGHLESCLRPMAMGRTAMAAVTDPGSFFLIVYITYVLCQRLKIQKC